MNRPATEVWTTRSCPFGRLTLPRWHADSRYCDQPVDPDAPSSYVGLFEHAREIAADYDIHLPDWIACDDEQFLAHRIPMFAPDPAS